MNPIESRAYLRERGRELEQRLDAARLLRQSPPVRPGWLRAELGWALRRAAHAVDGLGLEGGRAAARDCR